MPAVIGGAHTGAAHHHLLHDDAADATPVLLDENFVEYTQAVPLAMQDLSKSFLSLAVFNDTLFLSNISVVDYSILVGVDERAHTLTMGIIDYIRQYTWDKRLETGVKMAVGLGNKDMPTVISPQNYKLRFRRAMDRHFVAAPGYASVISAGNVGRVNVMLQHKQQQLQQQQQKDQNQKQQQQQQKK
jgi:hypothetical protein